MRQAPKAHSSAAAAVTVVSNLAGSALRLRGLLRWRRRFKSACAKPADSGGAGGCAGSAGGNERCAQRDAPANVGERLSIGRRFQQYPLHNTGRDADELSVRAVAGICRRQPDSDGSALYGEPLESSVRAAQVREQAMIQDVDGVRADTALKIREAYYRALLAAEMGKQPSPG